MTLLTSISRVHHRIWKEKETTDKGRQTDRQRQGERDRERQESQNDDEERQASCLKAVLLEGLEREGREEIEEERNRQRG